MEIDTAIGEREDNVKLKAEEKDNTQSSHENMSLGLSEIASAIRGEVVTPPVREMLINNLDFAKDVDEKPREYSFRLLEVGMNVLNLKYNNSLLLRDGSNKLVGYQDQLDAMTVYLMERETPNVLLLGPPGTGKTEMVTKWIFDRVNKFGKNQFVLQLKIEKLGEFPLTIMTSRFETLSQDLRFMRDLIAKKVSFEMALFMDEIHKLTQYPADTDATPLVEAMKEDLARGTIPTIGATTMQEFTKRLAPIPAIERRFEIVPMQQPNAFETARILRWRADGWTTDLNGHKKIIVSDSIIDQIITLANAKINSTAEPARSLKMLQRSLAQAEKRSVDEKGNSGTDEVTPEDVEKAFNYAGIELKSSVSAEHVENIIRQRVIGQPLALESIARAIRSSFYYPSDPKKPSMTDLFVGPTGVGKTESAKALAEAYFGSENYIVTVNGVDYSDPKDVNKLRGYIGDLFANNSRQLLLIDEIEKMSNEAVLSLMRVLDEGKIFDSNGIERNLSSAIVIATSNLGSDIFDTMYKTVNLENYRKPNELDPKLVAEWNKQGPVFRKSLVNGDAGKNNGFKKEFIERFSEVVPFLPLTARTKMSIVRMKLDKYAKAMKLRKNIEIILPEEQDFETATEGKVPYTVDPVTLFIATEVLGTDVTETGVREIERYIKNSIGDKVAKLLMKEPSIKRINIKTNGHADFENSESNEQGDILVETADNFTVGVEIGNGELNWGVENA